MRATPQKVLLASKPEVASCEQVSLLIEGPSLDWDAKAPKPRLLFPPKSVSRCLLLPSPASSCFLLPPPRTHASLAETQTSQTQLAHTQVFHAQLTQTRHSWRPSMALGVLCSLPWKRASRYNGVNFFDIFWHLTSQKWSKHQTPCASFNSPEPHMFGTTVFRDYTAFSCIFFCFHVTLLSSNRSLLSTSSLLCFSFVHIVGSLPSKIPWLNGLYIGLSKRTPKRQHYAFWSVHIVRDLRRQLAVRPESFSSSLFAISRCCCRPLYDAITVGKELSSTVWEALCFLLLVHFSPLPTHTHLTALRPGRWRLPLYPPWAPEPSAFVPPLSSNSRWAIVMLEPSLKISTATYPDRSDSAALETGIALNHPQQPLTNFKIRRNYDVNL